MEGQAKPNDGQNQAKKKDKKPKNIVIPPKKPKLSKAERRAIQEEQRAAKGLKADNKKSQKGQGGGENGNNGKGQGDAKGSSSGGGGGKKDVKNATSSAVQEENKENKGSEKNLTHPFFSHLPPFKGAFFVLALIFWKLQHRTACASYFCSLDGWKDG